MPDAVQEEERQILILVVDDDPAMRALFRLRLATMGYGVLEAEDGGTALAAFHRTIPDLILLDAILPGMDGFQICRAIKEDARGQGVPVIMVTALEDTESVNNAFAVGANEYITKPILWAVLFHRIRIQIDATRAWQKLQQQQVELEHHRDKLAYERILIEHILLRMRGKPDFEDRHIRYLLAPVERTAGDMLLSARNPDGTLHLFVGDATGHGLPSAIIGPTVSDIFYTMTLKGFTARTILVEINRQLRQKLPREIFLAGCFMALDPLGSHLFVWNGGMPDLLIVRHGVIVSRISSHAPFLGVFEVAKFRSQGVIATVMADDLVFAYSDGLTEAKNSNNELFGQDRVDALLAAVVVRDRLPLDQVNEAIRSFRGCDQQEDDITLVELTC